MRPPSPLLLLAVVCLCSCALQLRSCAAEVYKPPAPLAANAFVGGNTSLFVYPEASNGSSSNYSMPSVTERHRFGIALSGGGMRAATLGLGYLRGLHEVGFVCVSRSASSLDTQAAQITVQKNHSHSSYGCGMPLTCPRVHCCLHSISSSSCRWA